MCVYFVNFRPATKQTNDIVCTFSVDGPGHRSGSRTRATSWARSTPRQCRATDSSCQSSCSARGPAVPAPQPRSAVPNLKLRVYGFLEL